NRIRVSVLAPSRETRSRLETVLTGDYGLSRRIADKLRSAGCKGSEVAVAINYVARAQKNWGDPEFHITFANVDVPEVEADVPPPQPARLEITVLRGVTEKRSYSFLA